MAISRSLMNRQLQADGGIMEVAPREKFGIGSSIKKFVRKIIPNEVAEVAVKAAPFVAPFNPLLAAGMSGIGSFDQTGRIGDSLKGGALTYGLGQGARYLGGADFQGLQNPFAKDAFSMPTGSGGIKNLFKSNVQPVQAINEGQSTFGQDLTQDLIGGDTVSSADLIGDTGSTFSNFVDYGKDLLKKGAKAAFYDKNGKLDKAAVIGVATAAASYAEALALAKNAGVELTEEEYNQAQADEKREEYAGYLQNFFGGKKDGGRIGFESGANEMIKTQLLEEIMPDTDTDQMITIMTEDGPIRIPKSVYESMPNMFKDTTTGFGANITRVDRKFGSPKEGESEVGIMAIDVEAGDDEDEEDMMMAGITFSRPEKSYLFRRLGGSGGSDRSYTMPNLYKILSNPNKYPEDAAILKEIAIMGLGEGRKDGGRIGFKSGYSPGVVSAALEEYNSVYGTDSSGEKILVKDLYSGGFEEFLEIYTGDAYEKRANGGRIGYVKGGNRVSELLILRDGLLANGEDVSDIEAEIFQLTGKTFKSVGGISNIPTGKMRENNAGVVERDYRDEGGFVPVGIKERADDVPAMLSKNEFVMTADAVRGIGNGSVEEGSKKLYNTMKKAEQVGKA